MTGRICVVTGVTSGIGLALATRLARDGARLVGIARSEQRASSAADQIRAQVPGAHIRWVMGDLSELDQVRAIGAELAGQHDHIDALVLNAGAILPRRELTSDGFEKVFATNYLGPFLLTRLCRELLAAAPAGRVVTVTSSGHTSVKNVVLEDLPHGRDFSPLRTYITTKLLNLQFSNELARQTAGTTVTSNAVAPGFVRSGLGRDLRGPFATFIRLVGPFQRSPEKSASIIAPLVVDPQLAGVTGQYFTTLTPSQPSPLALDQDAARRLWDLSLALTEASP